MQDGPEDNAMTEPPMSMGDEEPMNVPTEVDGLDGNDEMDGDMSDNGGNHEIDKIFDKLDTEKKAAVIKYAKSMVNDSDDEMKSEGRKRLGNIVNEIVNDVISDRKNKDDKKIRNNRVTQENPFVPKRRK